MCSVFKSQFNGKNTDLVKSCITNAEQPTMFLIGCLLRLLVKVSELSVSNLDRLNPRFLLNLY